MEELIKLIPDTDEYYVGFFVREPILGEHIRPHYDTRIRALRNKKHRRLQFGDAQVILATGEIVPVKIMKVRQLTSLPRPGEAYDKRVLSDDLIGVDASTITSEQIKQVRLFVQRFGPDNKPI